MILNSRNNPTVLNLILKITLPNFVLLNVDNKIVVGTCNLLYLMMTMNRCAEDCAT